MMSITRRSLVAASLATPALAQTSWPERTIRLIVPFGAGGAIDTLSRTVAARFGEHANGQTLVVENRPGAGGTIAGAFVSQQRPDGLTLMMSDVGANAIGRLLYNSLPYDPMTAFTPIIHLVNLPAVLMAHPSVTANTAAEVIAAATARPDGYTFSSAGNGNGSHLFMELFLKRAGVKMVHVPYRSGAEMVTALIRGDAQFGFPTVSSGLNMIREGRAKAIAISTPGGTPALPGIPALAETLPGYNTAVWHGILAPAGMDAGLVLRINEVFGKIAAMDEVREQVFRAQAGSIVGGTPEQFAAFIRREYEVWLPIIREGNIRAE